MTWQTKQRYLNTLSKLVHKFGLSAVLLLVLFSLLARYVGHVSTSSDDMVHKINEQMQINEQQQQENNRLKQQVQAADNVEILESEARYRLGFSKPGETYYQY